MGFFDGLQEMAERQIEKMAKQAPDTGLVRQILDLQQKIEDGEDYHGEARTLEILKREADRRGLYY